MAFTICAPDTQYSESFVLEKPEDAELSEELLGIFNSTYYYIGDYNNEPMYSNGEFRFVYLNEYTDAETGTIYEEGYYIFAESDIPADDEELNLLIDIDFDSLPLASEVLTEEELQYVIG